MSDQTSAQVPYTSDTLSRSIRFSKGKPCTEITIKWKPVSWTIAYYGKTESKDELVIQASESDLDHTDIPHFEGTSSVGKEEVEEKNKDIKTVTLHWESRTQSEFIDRTLSWKPPSPGEGLEPKVVRGHV
ncbi:uncharacterized protein I206_100508 [Kwoniella pini CBS 10737]|uniref:Uncharacterized protein n=1 Tax=Kwoniella pini CBS 10737 TaxID=1296096 RepID=A0A1B9IDL7_9TREE|nr:uncharacterized protein I206_00819 [Kwoniella pini CBS 10737]OCF53514.1 hypothetical protein I206_00819 [Kwoniella pini CBS 10737]